jgi:hypothetical protein
VPPALMVSMPEVVAAGARVRTASGRTPRTSGPGS